LNDKIFFIWLLSSRKLFYNTGVGYGEKEGKEQARKQVRELFKERQEQAIREMMGLAAGSTHLYIPF
jgi:hypothetical protein